MQRVLMSEAEWAQLSSIARSRSMPAAQTERARIVLRCACGESNHAVAHRLRLTDATVGKWRRRFLRQIEPSVPPQLDIHLIVDNYSTHKHAHVKAWLAKRPRWHLHFTPTYSSWRNQVERLFGLIAEKATRRGSFGSVKELVSKIDHFVTQYNKACPFFVWTATADSILAKLERLASRISGTGQ